MAKKEQISNEIFYKRLQDLAGIKTITENQDKTDSTSTLIEYKVANDGLVYGIIKENHNYYIKKSTNKTNPNNSDFVYMGGLANIRDYQYKSLADAQKNMNFYLENLNEALGNTALINNTKLGKKNVIAEAKSDDAKKDLDAASQELPDLDKSLEKEKAEVSAVDNSETAPKPGAVETPEGGEAIESGGAADAADTNDETPVVDKTDNAEVPTDKTDELPADNGKEVDQLATKEIEKLIGKLGNELTKTSLDAKQTKTLLAQVLGSFKSDINGISPEDKKKLADKILKSEEEPVENPAEVEEGNCVECNTFENYMKGRGYDNMDECSEEEATDVVGGYATQHGDDQPEGEFEKIAVYVTPKMVESLKNDYGHVDYIEKLQPYVDKVTEAGGIHSYHDTQPFPNMNELDTISDADDKELPVESPIENPIETPAPNQPQDGDFDLTKFRHQEPNLTQDAENLGLSGRKVVDINLNSGTINLELSESQKKLHNYIVDRVHILKGDKKENLNEAKKSDNLKKIDEMVAKQWKLYENVVKENANILKEAQEISEIFGLSKSEQFAKVSAQDENSIRKFFIDLYGDKLKRMGALVPAYKKTPVANLYQIESQAKTDNWGGTIIRDNNTGLLKYVPAAKSGSLYGSDFEGGGTGGGNFAYGGSTSR